MTYQAALTNQPFQTNYPKVDEKLVYKEIKKKSTEKNPRLLSNPTRKPGRCYFYTEEVAVVGL